MLNSSVVFFALFILKTLLVSNSQQQPRGLIPPELLVDSNLYHVVPQGVILLWSGPAHLIPRGWAVCDGTQGTPDLRDRFVIGSDPNAQVSVGQKGGASRVTQIVTIRPTRLTVGQMPEHSHHVTTSPEDTGTICYDQPSEDEITTRYKNITKDNIQGDKLTLVATRNSNKVVGCQYRHTIEKQGNSETHSHEATANSINITPPFHALIYIMKL